MISLLHIILAEDRADALITDLLSARNVSNSQQEILKEMEEEHMEAEMEGQFTIGAGEEENPREKEGLNILHTCNQSFLWQS